jgi:hypothetical protein
MVTGTLKYIVSFISWLSCDDSILEAVYLADAKFTFHELQRQLYNHLHLRV